MLCGLLDAEWAVWAINHLLIQCDDGSASAHCISAVWRRTSGQVATNSRSSTQTQPGHNLLLHIRPIPILFNYISMTITTLKQPCVRLVRWQGRYSQKNIFGSAQVFLLTLQMMVFRETTAAYTKMYVRGWTITQPHNYLHSQRHSTSILC